MTEGDLSFRQITEQRLERQGPASVFESLKSFPVEYGMQSKEVFVATIDNSLARKKRPIVIAVLGESVSFKTNAARDMVANVFGFGKNKSTKTAELIRTTGEQIPVEGIFWGDAVTLTKMLGKTDNPDARFGEFSARDNSEATKVFGSEIAQSVKEHQGEREFTIAEGHGVTGMPWLKKNPKSNELTNVEPFGSDRGIAAFWDLASKKGPFAGLDYDVYWLGVVAAPWVREIGKKLRGKLGDVVNDPERAIKAIKEAGIRFDPKKVKEVIEWAHSSNSIESIIKTEEETNELIIKLATLGAFSVHADFRERLDERAEIIGRDLIPYILRAIGVKKHVFIAYNYQPLEEMEFNTAVPIENVILKRHPEVARTPNKRPVEANP